MEQRRPLKAAVIGFGAMGRGTAAALDADPDWDLAAIGDLFEPARRRARETYPGIRTEEDASTLIRDSEIDLVALTTLADARPGLIREALAAGKHIWAEKPIAATVREEEKLLTEIEQYNLHVAVNIFNRNAWYHERMLEFLASGQIGDLVSIRIRHQTPGLLPGTGHGPEGPPFHDCGMHYVDVARWYAGSEFADWHAQGVCLWGHGEPWHVDAHGTFENGVIFNVTQGFIFGQEARDLRNSSGLEAIGTRGVMTMSHDFVTVDIRLHGTDETHREQGAYGDKKLDVMAAKLAAAIRGGAVSYPTARDSVIASRVSQEMLDQARKNATTFGTAEDLERVKTVRAAKWNDGKGLY